MDTTIDRKTIADTTGPPATGAHRNSTKYMHEITTDEIAATPAAPGID